MEEARARGNEIIDQHQKALEGVFKTHKQEAVMQADTRIKTETASARQQPDGAVIDPWRHLDDFPEDE